MYTLPSLYAQAYTVLNASSPHQSRSAYEYTISINCKQINDNMVLLYSNAFVIILYSNYNICGRYLIIVLVRDFIHVFSCSYGFLKVTPGLLVRTCSELHS